MELSQLGSLLGSVIAPIAGAVAAYVAIRQDLAVLRTRVDAHDQTLAQLHKRADGAHDRIDDILTR
jgi:uncharacterized protein (DUF2062 family)